MSNEEPHRIMPEKHPVMLETMPSYWRDKVDRFIVSTYLNFKRVSMDPHSSIDHAGSISDQESRKHVKAITQTQVKDQPYACLDIHPLLQCMVPCDLSICPQQDDPPQPCTCG